MGVKNVIKTMKVFYSYRKNNIVSKEITTKNKQERGLIKMSVSKNKLLKRDEIKGELKEIDENPDYVVSNFGEVYRHYQDGYYKLKQRELCATENCDGYMYASFRDSNGKLRHYRVNRLVANGFIPNPDNLPIVGHADNKKHHNTADNLYWTTWSENTQKAVDDKLLVNDKGLHDSQSTQVAGRNLQTGDISIFGSITQAHKALGVSKSTIKRQISGQLGTPRCGYEFIEVNKNKKVK